MRGSRQARPGAGHLRVQGQGRAYAAVVGVTVGMLFAGLAVPLAFGRTPSAGDAAQPGGQLDPSFAVTGSPAPVGGPTAGGPALPSAVPSGPGTVTSGPDTSSPAAAPGATPHVRATSTRLTATDTGVTATTVKLGVVLLDIQALAPLGFSQPHFSPREQQQQYQTFIDQVNKSGGLLGRRIVPDYKTYNALDSSGSSSAGAICIQLAENDKVFAVIGVLGGNMDVCLTNQYGIPAISNTGNIVEAYVKGHNRLVTPFASFERGASNWGDLSARSGILRGRKVATVFTDIAADSRPETALVNALTAAGQATTYRAKLAGDQGTASSQMPVEIQKMQAAGVNTVFLVTNFITSIQFVQTADRRNFKPQYVVSDLGSLTAEGLITSMPRSFDGAYAFTAGQPVENASVAKCRKDFNAAHNTSYAAGNESGGLVLFCWMVKTFKAGADLAGPGLTRASLTNGFQALVDLPVKSTLGGSFRRGKTDYADNLRTMKYSSACKCYKPAGGEQPGRY